MEKIIDKSPALLPPEASLHLVIQTMIAEKKCCILVKDAGDNIIGIVTERDVLRKIASLDIEDKLKYKLATVMTKPVQAIYAAQPLLEQLRKLYQTQGYRHYPVFREPQNYHRQNLVGIVTATDFFRAHLSQAN